MIIIKKIIRFIDMYKQYEETRYMLRISRIRTFYIVREKKKDVFLNRETGFSDLLHPSTVEIIFQHILFKLTD